MQRLIWGQHLRRVHFKLTGQYPTNACPLCGQVDVQDHFLRYPTLNRSRKYVELRNQMIHQANSRGITYHMINTVAKMIVGKEVTSDKIPKHAQGIYSEQEDIS